MTPNLNELLAQDITNRIGISAHASSNVPELLQKVEEGISEPPRADLTSIATPFLEPLTFEAHYADGTTKQVPYDIDHIPIEVTVATLVIGSTLQETEDIAFNIRNTYSGNTDAGILMFPIDDAGTCAAARYTAKQLRTPVTERSSFAFTLIDPAEDGIKVPIPYPRDDLRASLYDRSAITRLLRCIFLLYVHSRKRCSRQNSQRVLQVVCNEGKGWRFQTRVLQQAP